MPSTYVNHLVIIKSITSCVIKRRSNGKAIIAINKAIAINLIFNHNPNLNITRKKLEKLSLFATSQTHFIFNSKFDNQIDGIALGSTLALVLANIFMGFKESRWLNEYNLNKPRSYLRYVDDILAAFDNEQHSLNFLIFLNNMHPNIKFTIKK